VTVPKGQRRLKGLSGNVISLYAKGMTTGDMTSSMSACFTHSRTAVALRSRSRATLAAVLPG
jgi:hypothetical protein